MYCKTPTVMSIAIARAHIINILNSSISIILHLASVHLVIVGIIIML